MKTETTEIDALLHENRKFAPPADFRRNALVSDTHLYDQESEAFWAAQAAELEWFEKWNDGARLDSRRTRSGSSAESSTSR